MIYDIEIELIGTMIAASLGFIFKDSILSIISDPLALLLRDMVKDVRGEWKARAFLGESVNEQRIEINQFATRVWGTIVCSNEECEYKFKGRLVQNSLVCYYEPCSIDGRYVDRGTMTLVVGEDGSTMAGSITMCRRAEIENGVFELTRSSGN